MNKKRARIRGAKEIIIKSVGKGEIRRTRGTKRTRLSLVGASDFRWVVSKHNRGRQMALCGLWPRHRKILCSIFFLIVKVFFFVCLFYGILIEINRREKEREHRTVWKALVIVFQWQSIVVSWHNNRQLIVIVKGTQK